MNGFHKASILEWPEASLNSLWQFHEAAADRGGEVSSILRSASIREAQTGANRPLTFGSVAMSAAFWENVNHCITKQIDHVMWLQWSSATVEFKGQTRDTRDSSCSWQRLKQTSASGRIVISKTHLLQLQVSVNSCGSLQWYWNRKPLCPHLWHANPVGLVPLVTDHQTNQFGLESLSLFKAF